jgi:hypothetical protein
MTSQLKRPIVFLIIDIVVFTCYYSFLINLSDQVISNVGELRFWGTSFLFLVATMIVSRIVLYLAYSIINSMITKTAEEKFLTDELGQLIKNKSTKNFNFVFLAGFITTMITVSAGASLTIMFHLLLFSVFIAFITQGISQIIYTKNSL